ncbi:MAG: aldo/keto reductase [Acidilobaceae archaeon]
MDYRILGKTGLKVSLLSYGVYSVTGMYGYVSRDYAIKILRRAWDLGVNFYDTADMYGFGFGEEIIREAFGSDVKDIIIATKIGYDFYSSRDKIVRRYDEKYLIYATRKSIERIGKKPLDLLQIHNPPLETLKSRELYKAMRRLVDEGLVEHIGVALGPETNILNHALEALNHSEVEALQFIYNILEQYPGRIIAGRAKEGNVGVIVRVPHAGGVLDESIKPGMENKLSDHRSLRRKEWYQWAFKTYNIIKKALQDKRGTPGQKSLKFIIQSINPDTIVLIANNIEKLEEYIEAIKIGDIDKETLEEIIRIHDTMMYENPELELNE